jgi:hypothetical protein
MNSGAPKWEAVSAPPVEPVVLLLQQTRTRKVTTTNGTYLWSFGGHRYSVTVNQVIVATVETFEVLQGNINNKH